MGTDGIIPRWEWRTFDEVKPAAARLASETPTEVLDTDELYVVSAGGEATVKVRNGLVDVKQLEEVDDHGLERWRPVLKRPTTFTAEDVVMLMQAFAANLGIVAVHKRRARYTVDGCAAELVDLVVNGTPMRTFAIESEDRAAIMRVLREMGLAGHPNVSYPRRLRGFTGLLPPRAAVIDIGTNSVKFHVAEQDGAGWRTVTDGAAVTRLGEGLQPGGDLGEAPMTRTAEAVCEMVLEARRAGAPVVAVGTAGLRIAGNTEAFTQMVRDLCSLDVEVIPGEEEARLGFVAATSSAGRDGSIVVFETGGGSSQFTFGAGNRILDRFSIDLGAVAVTERFGLDQAVSPAALGQAGAAVAAELGGLDGRPRADAVIGIGGVFTNLAAVMHGLAAYDPAVVEGTVLDRTEIDRQIGRYRTMDADRRRGIVGLQPARAEVILGGAVIVRAVLEALGHEAVTVSDRGLRHALLMERF